MFVSTVTAVVADCFCCLVVFVISNRCRLRCCVCMCIGESKFDNGYAGKYDTLQVVTFLYITNTYIFVRKRIHTVDTQSQYLTQKVHVLDA